MTDNKFTDEQIMKALKCCGDGAATSLCSGDGCPYLNEPDCLTELPRDALDLINRQRAEIAELREQTSRIAKRLTEGNNETD